MITAILYPWRSVKIRLRRSRSMKLRCGNAVHALDKRGLSCTEESTYDSKGHCMRLCGSRHYRLGLNKNPAVREHPGLDIRMNLGAYGMSSSPSMASTNTSTLHLSLRRLVWLQPERSDKASTARSHSNLTRTDRARHNRAQRPHVFRMSLHLRTAL